MLWNLDCLFPSVPAQVSRSSLPASYPSTFKDEVSSHESLGPFLSCSHGCEIPSPALHPTKHTWNATSIKCSFMDARAVGKPSSCPLPEGQVKTAVDGTLLLIYFKSVLTLLQNDQKRAPAISLGQADN